MSSTALLKFYKDLQFKSIFLYNIYFNHHLKKWFKNLSKYLNITLFFFIIT
jgi:hypothetical protein